MPNLALPYVKSRGAALLRGLNRLHRRQDGASYALSVVLIMPIYVLMIGLVIESSRLLLVQLAVVRASAAAARAASVWLPAECPAAVKQAKIRQAAAQALAPFASGDSEHFAAATAGRALDPQADAEYSAAYQRFTGGSRLAAAYLARKREFAWHATQVTWQVDSTAADAEVRVEVDFEMPFYLSGIGRFLGGPASWQGASFRTRHVTHAASLSLDTPLSKNRTLGIRYDTAH